jgi:putative transposase
MSDNHRVIEEPCEEKFSRTVLESGGSREKVADFNFLDGDSLPKYGEKPSGWKASGKRIKRGLYRSANSTVVNADLNGAANILRKVASKLGVNLDQLGRRCLTNVARVRIWVLPKPALSAESQRLQP